MGKINIKFPEDYEGDAGWTWVIRAWTSLFHNIVEIVGIVRDTDDIIGIVKESEDLQGAIGKGTL